MNTSFKMFPILPKPTGKANTPRLSPEAQAMQQMVRGIHF